ncbi:fibrinogen-like YCDxxxxGGGW domain-containing protein [Cyclobacterium plantarum]|uniref:Fibrinogen C-terminal domain-containing protein n=1 Tax=Cyclobacterium plantarum TaxID=2716263 RepID=A0ABX0HE48_9BACT|nr:fibrinogen-like YCDxxxxGGGW domain-containing protein [Cyclobacterium plantarum]NHE58608.1 hypothetical protein [Cyclobacterium plantarum]
MKKVILFFSIFSLVSGAVAQTFNPEFGDFNPLIKNTFEDSFEISPPSSDSEGEFSFTSSNALVATVSGFTVQIINPGETTITATQAAAGDFFSGSISTTLTVDHILVTNSFGETVDSGNSYVDANGRRGGSLGLSFYGEKKRIRFNDGLSMETASTSAYQIKQDYPESEDGYYWIAHPTINGGEPFRIYADMTTDGGGWTLIMCNVGYSGWTFSNAILRNQNSASLSANYSIIAWADAIKRSAVGFQYMLEASSRNRWGGIFTANQEYTFVKTNNSQTDITRNIRFDNYRYSLAEHNSLQPRMPWRSTHNNAFITTDDGTGNWWGTLVTSHSNWRTAPWMSSENPTPAVIWYWVR